MPYYFFTILEKNADGIVQNIGQEFAFSIVLEFYDEERFTHDKWDSNNFFRMAVDRFGTILVVKCRFMRFFLWLFF